MACATLGPDGAWLLQRDGLAVHAREDAPITVVDTVGAGDCFLAGLITALLARPERGRSAGPTRGRPDGSRHRSPVARRVAPRAGECQPLRRAGGLHAPVTKKCAKGWRCGAQRNGRRPVAPYSAGLRLVCGPGCGDGQRGLGGVVPSASAAESRRGGGASAWTASPASPSTRTACTGVAAFAGLAPGLCAVSTAGTAAARG